MPMRSATITNENIISAHKYIVMWNEWKPLSYSNPMDFAKILKGYNAKRKIEWYLGSRLVNTETEYEK